MANINQEEIDKIPMILEALHSMCLWDISKERCDEEILFYRSQWIEFFVKYYSNWLDKNVIQTPSCMRKIINIKQIH